MNYFKRLINWFRRRPGLVDESLPFIHIVLEEDSVYLDVDSSHSDLFRMIYHVLVDTPELVEPFHAALAAARSDIANGLKPRTASVTKEIKKRG